MNLSDSNNIPGMIEPAEQQMLFNLASKVELSQGDCFVEFGTFFGRSTYCIAEGLKANQYLDSSHTLHAYDSFKCDEKGGFAACVHQFAKIGNIADKLTRYETKIGFRKVFEHYLSGPLSEGLVTVVEAELRDSQPPETPILLMHIDSPKYYAEFKTVLYRFFPKLKKGAVIIFQDYFYHWSATLIAATQMLVETGMIKLHYSVSSSMVVEVLEPITLEAVQRVDQAIENADIVPLINRAIVACNEMTIDRKEQFLPRLQLSKVQYLWESKDFSQAAVEFKSFLFSSGGYVNQFTLDDMFELMNHGFSIRELYELDHA